MDIEDEVIATSCKAKDNYVKQYTLTGVILHHGQKATGGHYCAYVKELNNNLWRSVNDLKISSITEDEILDATKTAYILFYTRHK